MSTIHRLAKWDNWAKQVKLHVTDLLVKGHIFWEIQEIIKANPRIQKPSSFYEWMANCYATDAVIGIRRQLDTDKRSISLMNLLTDIIRAPTVLSREQYVASYLEQPHPDDARPYIESAANRYFDKFAGPGKSHVDPSIIRADLDRLLGHSKNLERYANKRIAHFNRGSFKLVPTHKEVKNCLDLIEELTKKYLLLIQGAAPKTLLPVWTYDWKEIFLEPWLRRKPRR